jgi:hypothetical protein
MKYQAVQRLAAEFPVTCVCAVLRLPISSYYCRLRREPSPQAVKNRNLLGKIEEMWRRTAHQVNCRRWGLKLV